MKFEEEIRLLGIAASDIEETEIRAFAEYIRGAETRANLSKSDNGAVIPASISRMIIRKVKDICPIYRLATVYNAHGKLIVPVWGDNDGGENISCVYAEEFEDLTSKSGKFTGIELTGYLAGALTKVSRSLINSSDLDVAIFIVNEIAIAIAEWLEKELILGTHGKMTGILSTTTTMESAATTAITADEIIKLQAKIKQVFQLGAVWIMHSETLTYLRLLKDNDGRYLLQDDATNGFGYKLLGKPVYTSDNMPTMAAGAKAIAYGNMSGLSVKLAKQIEIQILKENYAAQHALGVVGWVDADSKITDAQRIAVLTMKK